MNFPKTNKKATPARPPLRYLSPLHQATRRVAEHFRAHGGQCGLGGSEAHVVSYLDSYGPVPVGTLVRVFGLKKTTLTGLLDRLEDRGLVRRELNPDDRRSFLVGLTAAGRRAADDVRAMLEEFEDALDAELSDVDRRAFSRVMEAIARVTEPNRQGDT